MLLPLMDVKTEIHMGRCGGVVINVCKCLMILMVRFLSMCYRMSPLSTIMQAPIKLLQANLKSIIFGKKGHFALTLSN